MSPRELQLALLQQLYGLEVGAAAFNALRERLENVPPLSNSIPKLSQHDALLITYAGQFWRAGEQPLRTLESFARRRLAGGISGMHILPFYPSTSDDGFAVADYRQVDPELGNWEDIAGLAQFFTLMMDAVINHVSASHPWFRAYLAGDPRYQDYFISLPPETDLSQVVRPRTTPLLTRFEAVDGPRWVWTTFSADQVDLNFHCPRLLLDVIEILLEYVAHGARFLRLDAIAYLWKEPGTSCIHLPQTHAVIRLIRAVLDELAPHVSLITETNVPHQENLSYFGDGKEAQLVYNFALPPLVLHTFVSGDASKLREWASGLVLPSQRVAFFNFLASHDGIGLNPVRGILSDEEIDHLVQLTLARGGLVSSKSNPDGSQSPYELNVTYWSALNDPAAGEPLDLQVKRFLASQSILLAVAGLPGIYVHSLFATPNWQEGVQASGRSRTINRRKFEADVLEEALESKSGAAYLCWQGYSRLLRARGSSEAFHPYGAQFILESGDSVFALLRVSPDGLSEALCLHNISAQPQTIRLDLERYGLPAGPWRDLLDGGTQDLGQSPTLRLEEYQTVWLAPE